MKNVHQREWVRNTIQESAEHQCCGIAEQGQPDSRCESKDSVQDPADSEDSKMSRDDGRVGLALNHWFLLTIEGAGSLYGIPHVGSNVVGGYLDEVAF
jgi:hypothetical protein